MCEFMPVLKWIGLYWNKTSKSIAPLDTTSFSLLVQDECKEVNGTCELLMHHLVSNSALNDKDLVLQDTVKLSENFQWKRGKERKLQHK